MKKVLLGLIVSLTLAVAHGQTAVYHPFPDSNAVWSIVSCNTPPPSCYTRWYNIKGDTIINAITYHKLNNCDSNGVSSSVVGAIREDTTGKKVYFMCLNSMPIFCNPSQTEKLLYNFSAGVGDTIHYSATYGAWTVNSIDSIQLLNGTYRKRFSTTACASGSVIEGIGSGDDLLYGCYNTGPGIYTLLCFRQNNILLYVEPMNNTCYVNTVSVSEINDSLSVSISPNPFSKQTTLQMEKELHNATLTLYNCFGQAVKELSIINSQSAIINRDDLPSGIYFVRLAEGDKIFTEKLVITDK